MHALFLTTGSAGGSCCSGRDDPSRSHLYQLIQTRGYLPRRFADALRDDAPPRTSSRNPLTDVPPDLCHAFRPMPPERTSRAWRRVGLGYKSPLRHGPFAKAMVRGSRGWRGTGAGEDPDRVVPAQELGEGVGVVPLTPVFRVGGRSTRRSLRGSFRDDRGLMEMTSSDAAANRIPSAWKRLLSCSRRSPGTSQ
jgi:hypothetical protein